MIQKCGLNATQNLGRIGMKTSKNELKKTLKMSQKKVKKCEKKGAKVSKKRFYWEKKFKNLRQNIGETQITQNSQKRRKTVKTRT
jgi:hypothetical protein